MSSGEVSGKDPDRHSKGGNSEEALPCSAAGAARFPPVFPAAAVAGGRFLQGLVAGSHSPGGGFFPQGLHPCGRG